MQMNLEDGRLIFTYEEDGSKWIFHGFIEKENAYFMKLSELETKSNPQATHDEQDIYLTKQDYLELRREVEQFIPAHRVYLVHQDPVQSKLDDFQVTRTF